MVAHSVQYRAFPTSGLLQCTLSQPTGLISKNRVQTTDPTVCGLERLCSIFVNPTQSPPCRIGRKVAGKWRAATNYIPRHVARRTSSRNFRFALDEIVEVSERQIADTMLWLSRMHGTRVEGSGAVATAAVLARGKWDGPVAAIVSGGNVDQRVWNQISADAAAVA